MRPGAGAGHLHLALHQRLQHLQVGKQRAALEQLGLDLAARGLPRSCPGSRGTRRCADATARCRASSAARSAPRLWRGAEWQNCPMSKPMRAQGRAAKYPATWPYPPIVCAGWSGYGGARRLRQGARRAGADGQWLLLHRRRRRHLPAAASAPSERRTWYSNSTFIRSIMLFVMSYSLSRQIIEIAGVGAGHAGLRHSRHAHWAPCRCRAPPPSCR